MRIGRSIAAVLVSALALAGCSEDPQPIVAEPSATPTPSPTASATPTESAKPKAESPEEFIRRWNEIQTVMQSTGDVDEYLDSSTKRCEPCSKFADLVRTYYRDGGYIKTEGWEIRAIKAVNPGATKVATFILQITSAPTEYKKSDSGEVERLSGAQRAYTLVLEKRADRWLVDDFLVNAQ